MFKDRYFSSVVFPDRSLICLVEKIAQSFVDRAVMSAKITKADEIRVEKKPGRCFLRMIHVINIRKVNKKQKARTI